MVSILSSYDNVPKGYRKVYIRMRSIQRSELQNLIQELESKTALLYVVDHTENSREIYPLLTSAPTVHPLINAAHQALAKLRVTIKELPPLKKVA